MFFHFSFQKWQFHFIFLSLVYVAFDFFTSSPTLIVYYLFGFFFLNSHLRGVKWFLMVWICLSPIADGPVSFRVLIGHSYVLFEEMCIHSICPFKKLRYLSFYY